MFFVSNNIEAQGCGEGLDQRRRTMPCEIRLIAAESPQPPKRWRGLGAESRETRKDEALNVPYKKVIYTLIVCNK